MADIMKPASGKANPQQNLTSTLRNSVVKSGKAPRRGLCMQIRTMYSIDGEDAPALAPSRILELESLISPYVLPEEIEPNSRRDRHPGVIVERMRTKVSDMETELETLEFKSDFEREMSLKSCEGILEGVRSRIARTEEIMTEFVEEFHIAAGLKEGSDLPASMP
jgi:hypothetical protein